LSRKKQNQNEIQIQPQIEPKEGFSIRVVVVMIFAGILFLPGVLWMQLLVGGYNFGSIGILMLLIASEISSIVGLNLSIPELYCIYIGSIWMGSQTLGTTLLYRAYLQRSPVRTFFGLPPLPRWIAPPPGSEAYHLRLIVHPDWFLPLVYGTIFALIWELRGLVVGYILREILIKEENLPFPTAVASAQVVLSLARAARGEMIETGSRQLFSQLLFSVTSIAGLAWGIIVYFFPAISLVATGRQFTVVTLPWNDLTQAIEPFVPGASFGVVLTLAAIGVGLIIDFKYSLSIFIGSFALYFIGNHLLISVFHDTLIGWRPGIDLQYLWYRSIQFYWLNVAIGLALAAVLLPIAVRPKLYIDAFRSLAKTTGSRAAGSKLGSIWVLLLLYILLTLPGLIWTYLFIPELPLPLMILMTTVVSFFLDFLTARILGETGITVTLDVPYVGNLVNFGTLLGLDIHTPRAWMAPSLAQTGGYLKVFDFKITDLTGTKIRSYVKTLLVSIALAWPLSIIFIQFFWSIADVPSNLFPVPFWPMNAATTYSMMVGARGGGLKPDWIAISFVIGAAIFGISRFAPFIPISISGLAAGVMAPIAIAVSTLIGAVVRKFLEYRWGVEGYRQNMYTIVAGTMVGEGIALSLATLLRVLLQASWPFPY